MDALSYEAKSTALLIVDPYNDFLSEGGKLYPLIETVAKVVPLLDNLRKIEIAVRAAEMQIVIVPHRRWRARDYERWRHPNPSQQGIVKHRVFAAGEWGGEWHPDFAPQVGDVVVTEHWAQSGSRSRLRKAAERPSLRRSSGAPPSAHRAYCRPLARAT